MTVTNQMLEILHIVEGEARRIKVLSGKSQPTQASALAKYRWTANLPARILVTTPPEAK